MKLYEAIAQQLGRIERCSAGATGDNAESNIADAHETIEYLCKHALPRGSGFDAGCSLDFDKSNSARLAFVVPFHCMDANGFYCGWRDYCVIVKASLEFGYALRITGRQMRLIAAGFFSAPCFWDWNYLREYIADTFHHALCVECRYATPEERATLSTSIVTKGREQ